MAPRKDCFSAKVIGSQFSLSSKRLFTQLILNFLAAVQKKYINNNNNNKGLSKRDLLDASQFCCKLMLVYCLFFVFIQV